MKAYIINLPKAKDRRSWMEGQIAKIKGLDFIFFDAIDPSDERFESYRSYWDWDFLTKLYRGKPLSANEKACYASHFALWEECLRKNESILIFEDDIVFLDNFEEAIPKLSENLGFVRMMAYFQKVSFPFQEGIDQTFDDICGSQGYFLTPASACFFLKASKIWFCPVDNYMDKTYLHGVPNLFFSPPVIQRSTFQTYIPNRDIKVVFHYKILKELLALFERIWRSCYAWKNRKKSPL